MPMIESRTDKKFPCYCKSIRVRILFVNSSFFLKFRTFQEIGLLINVCYTNSKSKMILRRLGGGDEAYCIYVEEADNEANKNSALI